MKLSRKEILSNHDILEKMLLVVHNLIQSEKTKDLLVKKLQQRKQKRRLKQSQIKKGILKDFMEWDTSEIARQFTMSEWELFSKITPKEFVGMAWQKEKKEILAPNLTKLTSRFNQVNHYFTFFLFYFNKKNIKVSYWVATRVLTEENKKRTEVMEHFIEIMVVS